MDFLTPKHHPWRPILGHESIDSYPVPSLPIANQQSRPCYVPAGMKTLPLKFPSLVCGFNRSPVHAARAALATRYTAEKWFEDRDSIMKEVSSNLEDSTKVRSKLEDIINAHKQKLAHFDSSKDKKRLDICITCFKLKVNELSEESDKLIKENAKLEDFKREIQNCERNIEAPLQIAQECLSLRESRHKSELINDAVEKALMKEIEVYQENKKKMKKNLKQIKNQLVLGRKIQNDLETFLKPAYWVLHVDRREEEIMKLGDSQAWMSEADCLLNKSISTRKCTGHLKEQISAERNEVCNAILKYWNETNVMFDCKVRQLTASKNEIEDSLEKIKNEIYSLEKNIHYLKSNKGIHYDFTQSEEQLKLLLRTEKNLVVELEAKKHSLFIDDQTCISMRKCFPIVITIRY